MGTHRLNQTHSLQAKVGNKHQSIAEGKRKNQRALLSTVPPLKARCASLPSHRHKQPIESNSNIKAANAGHWNRDNSCRDITEVFLRSGHLLGAATCRNPFTGTIFGVAVTRLFTNAILWGCQRSSPVEDLQQTETLECWIGGRQCVFSQPRVSPNKETLLQEPAMLRNSQSLFFLFRGSTSSLEG